jgi:uncharacterized protein YjbI with pentapeptide repeats
MLSLAIPAAVLLALFIATAYRRRWTWTGFIAADGTRKGLWDWLQLVLVPAGLAAALFALNSAQSTRARHAEDHAATRDRAAALDDRREDTLRTYLDRMSDLVLTHHLLHSRSDAPNKLARTWTLTALSRLDGRRKGVVVSFLLESGMIVPTVSSAVSLTGADLRGARMPHRLDAGSFGGADLRGADFSGSDLGSAAPPYGSAAVDFTAADLRGARFTGATLAGVQFDEADLRGARFDRAHVGVNLVVGTRKQSTTTFEAADLRGARFTGAHLDVAGFVQSDLQDATFANAGIQWSEFAGSCLTRTNFSGARIVYTDFAATDGVAPRFARARLDRTVTFTDRGLPAVRMALIHSIQPALGHHDARLSEARSPSVPAPRRAPSCRYLRAERADLYAELTATATAYIADSPSAIATAHPIGPNP